MPDYGALSNRDLEDQQAGARVEVEAHKRNPADFILWKLSSADEPGWPSPWGTGRPGWHIECSAMSARFLGKTFDIHGGGLDLIFPHHESEIAQAEGATGQKPFVQFWMHAAMVHHDGAKMSKSLGNLVMVRDLLQDWPADALRLYLASHHYRRPWSHSQTELAQAGQLARKLGTAVTADGGSGSPLDVAPAQAAFETAMDNDLDAVGAMVVLERLADEVLQAAQAGQDVRPAQAAIRTLGRVLGLRLDSPEPEPRVIEGWNEYLIEFE